MDKSLTSLNILFTIVGSITKIQYSVITFNIGGYEVLHEIEHKSSRAEYIYITDDKSVTSKTWDVRYIDNPYPEDNFYTCFHIRYNPFDFASTDIAIKIDGSLQILDRVDEIIDYFNRGGYDICLEAHPLRKTISEEYEIWCKTRGYSREQADRVMQYMNSEGYDVVNYRGLYQTGIMIQRKNPVNLELNASTLALIQDLAPEGKKVDRLDQTISSFIINSRFSKRLKAMVVDERILHSKYFRLLDHGGREEREFDGLVTQPFLFNRPATIAKLNYHAKAFYSDKWLPRPIVLFIYRLSRIKKALWHK